MTTANISRILPIPTGSGNAKMVLATITHLADESDIAEATLERIADIAGISQRTVAAKIKQIESRGLLYVIRAGDPGWYLVTAGLNRRQIATRLVTGCKKSTLEAWHIAGEIIALQEARS